MFYENIVQLRKFWKNYDIKMYKNMQSGSLIEEIDGKFRSILYVNAFYK